MILLSPRATRLLTRTAVFMAGYTSAVASFVFFLLSHNTSSLYLIPAAICFAVFSCLYDRHEVDAAKYRDLRATLRRKTIDRGHMKLWKK